MTTRGISGVRADDVSRAKSVAVDRGVTVGKTGSPSASHSESGHCTGVYLELSEAPAPPSSAFPVIVGRSLH